MLTFILKKEWFEKIESGEKTVEYREATPYWNKRVASFIGKIREAEGSDLVIFRLGYTKKFLKARITKIEKKDGKDTDLKCDNLVFALHFKLLNGENNEKL